MLKYSSIRYQNMKLVRRAVYQILLGFPANPSRGDLLNDAGIMAAMVDDSLNKPTSTYKYPLERYLVARPRRESKIDFSKFVDHSTTQKDFENLAKVSNILKLAEEEIDHIESNMSPQEGPQTVYLKEPAYFDEDFDQKQYIRDLVKAKINRMNIVEQESTKIREKILIKQQLEGNTRERKDNEIQPIERSLMEDKIIQTNKLPSYHGYSESLNTNFTNIAGVNNNVSKKQNVRDVLVKRRLEKVVLNIMEIPAYDSESTKKIPEVINIPKASVKNNQIFEINAQENEPRENIKEKISKIKLTLQAMPSLNIRTQLVEQKNPSLDIFPSNESNSHREKTDNVGLVEVTYCEEKVLTPKKVQISEDVNVAEEFSFVGSSDSQIEISTDKLLTMDQSKRDRILDKILRPHRIVSSSSKHSRRETKYADNIPRNYESPYMFLGGHGRDNLSYDCNSRSGRNVSKLRKYAIPEIQRIYSSGPIQSFDTTYTHKKGASSVKSCSVPLTLSKNESRSRHVYLHSGSVYDDNIPSTSRYGEMKSAAEYIPYTKLTVGGYSAKDVKSKVKRQKHVSQSVGNKGDLMEQSKVTGDKIDALSKNSDREDGDKPDDNVPEELEIDENDDDSLSNGTDNKSVANYADDFDEDDSKSQLSTEKSKSNEGNYSEEFDGERSPAVVKKHVIVEDVKQKRPKLNMKTKIDVFDFVHHIERKDDFTQSCPISDWSFKETQTSPRGEDVGSDRSNGKNKAHPDIIEPKMDIANITLKEMIQLQERLSYINSQIISNQFNDKLNQPATNSSGNDSSSKKDATRAGQSLEMVAEVDNAPKNTQTSPMKTSHMMTSPAKMISRILSPIFHDTYTDAHTSPMDPNFGVIDETSDITQMDRTVTPQVDVPLSPKDILSNINSASRNRRDRQMTVSPESKPSTSKNKAQGRPNVKFKTRKPDKDSTDGYTDVSHSESSETHSIGEINLRIYKKKSVLIKSQSTSHSTSASFTTNSSSDVQIDSINKKSDGELSIGQVMEKSK